MSFLKKEIIKQTSLAVAMDDSQTTMIVAAGSNVVTPPSIAAIAASRSLTDLSAAEHVKVLSRSTDTFTIERAQGGTSARAHVLGEIVLGLWSPEHFYEIEETLTKLETFLARTLGRNLDCVLRSSNPSAMSAALQVTESAVPGMSVLVKLGMAFVDAVLFEQAANGTVAIAAAPVSDSRIDIVQIAPNAYGYLALEIKQGAVAASPVEPDADADAFKLAAITVASGTTSIINGLITDRRVFA